jgi:hypothetical protein
MNKIHHISFRTESPITKAFQDIDIDIEDGILNAFDIGENDLEWDKIQAIIKVYGKDAVIDKQYRTTFTQSEMDNAQFYALSGDWYFEYPQPENNFGYTDTTYTPDAGCKKCGIDKIQQHSFSIKKAPKWGRRDIFLLNWVPDEYFISGNLKDELEKRFSDMRFQTVLKYPKAMVLDDVFQLVVESLISVPVPNNTEVEICSFCGKKKFHSIIGAGFFPAPVEKNFSIAKTVQYFGSGGSAFRVVIINKAVYQLLSNAEIKGVSYIPCQN